MSERGSFVTQYIYCGKCLEVLKHYLLKNDKYLCSQIIKTWEKDGEEELLIIAGKIGGLYIGEESEGFWADIGVDIARKICHTVRVAVITEHEGSEKIFIIEPS